MPQRDSTDAAAVVTGHSRGLGAAIATHLLSHRVRVLGVARRSNADLAGRHGAALTEVQLDLADAAALDRWLHGDALELFLGRAPSALLVNNAGIVQPTGPLDTQDIATVARAVAVNVSAPLMLSAAFVVATRGARDRRILHISSGAGRNAYAGWSVYCATKAALDHHARAVALDRTPGLRVSSVAPGVIDTDMQAEVRATTDDKLPGRRRFVEMKREGRLLSPDLAGRAVVEFLLSDAFGREPVADVRPS
jgi:NAD(P)-dependent dehydrogenase (short-subunit alcohol dehydrogenase family)